MAADAAGSVDDAAAERDIELVELRPAGVGDGGDALVEVGDVVIDVVAKTGAAAGTPPGERVHLTPEWQLLGILLR